MHMIYGLNLLVNLFIFRKTGRLFIDILINMMLVKFNYVSYTDNNNNFILNDNNFTDLMLDLTKDL